MKTALKDIHIIEYNKLQDKTAYDYALQFGNLESLDYFNFGDIFEMTFEEVKLLQNEFSGGIDFETYFSFLMKNKKITEKQFLKTSIFSIYRSMLYLKNEIEKLNLAESRLNSRPDADMISAGIDIFSDYANFGQYYSLAKGDITKIENIKKIKYSLCFLFLKYEKDISDFERALQRIKMKNI
jgi:hypothetical protein